MALTALQLKARARELGADLVGIASAAVLNAHPPDPRYPQTPARLSPEIRSCVAIVKRIPVAAFRAKSLACVHHVDQLVLREMDKVAYRIARFLEEEGFYAFPLAAQETIWEMKNASYGYLSTRHVAIEAGLGTLGLEVNLLTREFGPRCYTTAILTSAELEPDQRIAEQLCIGEPCSRCLHSCPADAVRHWGLDKRACATEAQEYGYATILKTFTRFIEAPAPEQRLALLRGGKWRGIYQGLLRVVGAFGDCPRCLAVCPVGDDYRYLVGSQKVIPEKTPEKVAQGKAFLQARRSGAEIAGLTEGRIRWVGEDGYRPPKARKVT
ncbi:MAG: hypothetical protein HYV08_03310 [Deltaproteobacteria bacterium]|nr:hypothetical protein [Deltaproteobacteria bacterium]MBI3076459.1 hypothetical protein [Deltaproteobacteria bacterium]